jgi:addiction module HigA family antidote
MSLEGFLIPMRITQRELADSIHVPFKRVNQIVPGKRGLTPSTTLRLAKFFGMSAGFWLNLQMRVDLENAENKEHSILSDIKPLPKGRGPKHA